MIKDDSLFNVCLSANKNKKNYWATQICEKKSTQLCEIELKEKREKKNIKKNTCGYLVKVSVIKSKYLNSETRCNGHCPLLLTPVIKEGFIFKNKSNTFLHFVRLSDSNKT
jgi:hypothetical protein